MLYDIPYIGAAIQEARRRRGLSQRELADQAGVTQPMVSLAERGKDMRVSTLQQIAAALDLVPLLVPRRAVPVVRGVLQNVPE